MSISLEQFASQAAEAGVLAAEELQAVIDALPAESRDAEALARALVARKQLTPLQAKLLYRGKGRDLVLGNYVLLDKLGEGGMGTVCKARHRRMNRVVALKLLNSKSTKSPDLVKRFQREVEAAAQLIHPNIVTAFDADEARGAHFLVMEYVPGEDLASTVRRHGPLSVARALDAILHAARGLEFAHSQGVVHRDIKPGNLLLAADGTVKILDMGLARLTTLTADKAELTGTDQIMGTVDYMAPEQAVSTKHADARADIYSLGMTLWYLLTGEPAYAGDTLIEKVLAHREQPVPSLAAACAQAPAQLDAVFQKMVAKQPADRYASMSEVIEALSSIAQTLPVVPVKAASATTGVLQKTRVHRAGEKLADATESLVASPLSQQPFGVGDTLSLNLPGGDTDPTTNVNLQPAISLIDTRRGSTRPRKRRQTRFPWLLAIVPAAALMALVAFVALQRGDDTEPSSSAPPAVVQAGAAVPDNQLTSASPPPPPTTETVAATPTPAAARYALQFDGVDDYVELPMIPLTGKTDVTLEAWVTPTDDYSSRTADPWIDGHIFGWEGFEDLCLAAYAEGLGASITGAPNQQVGVRVLSIRQQDGITLNQRQHVALTVAGGVNASVYINGVLVRALKLVDPIVDRRTQPKIGAYIDHNKRLERAFAGRIDEIRLSQTVRYTKLFVPKDELTKDDDTVALYRFDDGAGDKLTDSSSYGFHGRIIGAKWVKLP